MNKRTAYVLTLDFESTRAVFSKGLLEKLGFDVILIKGIKGINHEDKFLKQRHSFHDILSLIKDSQSEYSYVFEDDINILEDITLDEIIEYEKISEMFFYLGMCEFVGLGTPPKNTGLKIRNHDVYSKSGWVRGSHAMGFSRKGAEAVLNFSKELGDTQPNADALARAHCSPLAPEGVWCWDVIIEKFTETHPANICRYDLESYIPGHKGVFFQDRTVFPPNGWA